MAAEVQPLPALRAPPGPASLTPEQAHWKTFKNQLLLPSPHNAAVTSITVPDVNPTGAQADTFAVTSGGRVQIYSAKTRKLVKTISRFGVDDTARSGALRRDGRILLAGGDSGVVQAFDTGSRAILRQWRGEFGHKLPVHVVRWSPRVLTDLMSASDDRTVRVWDLTEDSAKWTGIGHEDYVRSGAYLPDQEGMVVSGSYDQTVRLWDTRQVRPALTFKHASPIEHVLPLSSATVAAASGNEVSILDLTAGKVEHVVRSHQKTVTSLCMAQKGQRLLTAGLDGHVKAHNTESWEVLAGFKYPSPVLSIAVVAQGSEDRHLAVGLQNGLLSLRTRLAGAEKGKAREKEKRMGALLAGTADEYERKQKKKDMRQGIRARDRGKDFTGESAGIIISGNDRSRPKKLQPWQRSLRENKFGLALDQVLAPVATEYNNVDTITLLTALQQKTALSAALANRDEERLLPIVNWCLRYVNQPRLTGLACNVLERLLALHSHRLGEWAESEGDEGREVLNAVSRILKKVRGGVDMAHRAENMLGCLEVLEAG